MKTRIIVAAIGLPVVFAALFFLPPLATAVVTSVITALASYEFLTAWGKMSRKRVLAYSAVCAVCLQVSQLSEKSAGFSCAAFILFAALLFIEAILSYPREDKIKTEEIVMALIGGGVIPMALSSLVSLRTMGTNGHLYVLLPLVAAFCSDSGAYFAGMFLGKHKATPVSPKKSWEGYIGGVLAGIICMLLYGLILALCKYEVNFIYLVIYGLVGALITELGDLAFSYIKREYGIKDYGKLLPGHGGMMDRFDSMTFTAPTILALVTIIPAF